MAINFVRASLVSLLTIFFSLSPNSNAGTLTQPAKLDLPGCNWALLQGSKGPAFPWGQPITLNRNIHTLLGTLEQAIRAGTPIRMRAFLKTIHGAMPGTLLENLGSTSNDAGKLRTSDEFFTSVPLSKAFNINERTHPKIEGLNAPTGASWTTHGADGPHYHHQSAPLESLPEFERLMAEKLRIILTMNSNIVSPKEMQTLKDAVADFYQLGINARHFEPANDQLYEAIVSNILLPRGWVLKVDQSLFISATKDSSQAFRKVFSEHLIMPRTSTP